MGLLCPSIRCLGSCPQLVQWQQKGYQWRRDPWIQRRRRAGSIVPVGKVDEGVREVFDSKQSMQVSVYIDSLLDWNQRINLTAVNEREAVMERHIMDSLALLPVLEAAYGEHSDKTPVERLKVVDVGTGAGLPGMVFAIARPAWQITLLESLQKRCNFLDYAVEKSGLSNVKVVRARAEDGGQDKNHREVYDVAVARAVAEMRVLWKYSSICVLLAMGAQEDMEVHQMDVKTAFLYGHLDEEVYMALPEGLDVPHSERHKFCKLRKSIYGLKQSSRQWYQRIDVYLLKIGFVKAKADQNVYILRDEVTGCLYLALYVDDCVLVSSSLELLVKVKVMLQEFEMVDLKEIHQCLGMQIHRNRKEG